MWCVTDSQYEIIWYICARGFLDSNFNEAVIQNVSHFLKLPPRPFNC